MLSWTLTVVGLLLLAAVLWLVVQRPGASSRKSLVKLVGNAGSAPSPILRHLPLADNSVFISYRRQDSGEIVGRLDDHLARALGRNAVFKDVASIKPGQDFRRQIEGSLDNCRAFMCVMGDQWLGGGEVGRRRIDDPTDFVRIEVETALRRDLPIIPVLIRGMRMLDPSQLPEPIRELAYRHAVGLRGDPDFHNDLETILDSLGDVLDH